MRASLRKKTEMATKKTTTTTANGITLEYKVEDKAGVKGIVITRAQDAKGDLAIPSEINGTPVMGIGEKAFKGCDGLTGVTIPGSVTSIEYGAFYGCSWLTSVVIPNSVTFCGGDAFSYCCSLTSVSLPKNLKGKVDEKFLLDVVFKKCPKGLKITYGEASLPAKKSAAKKQASKKGANPKKNTAKKVTAKKTAKSATSSTTALHPKMQDVPGHNFKISCTHVTQAQWEAIMGKNPSNPKGADLPVNNVSWYDCQEFISRLNDRTGSKFRLPTGEECCRVCMAKRSKSIEEFPVVCGEFGCWRLEAYDDNGEIGYGDEVSRSPGDPDWGYAYTRNCSYDGGCGYDNDDEEFSMAPGDTLHPTDREDNIGLVLVLDCE